MTSSDPGDGAISGPITSPDANARAAQGSTPTEPTLRLSGNRLLSRLYLLLSAAGAILTSLSNWRFIQESGASFDLGLFIRQAQANPAAEFISRDLAIAATAFTIWIVVESRRLRMRGLPWVLLLCFTLAFACGGPLFLHLRERRLIELAAQSEAATSESASTSTASTVIVT
ncbi:MAG: DUF2834 domain-containing protein [Synechococcaceae cyanobacterium]|nr:DUF2834 domain-containing protein [Synechococcaceae cyanobacterium]